MLGKRRNSNFQNNKTIGEIMLSILIPIYQENCVNLVNDLLLQAKELSC